MIDNGYGKMVKEACDQCGLMVKQVANTPYPCNKCGKTLCGICAIDGWDGEETTLCYKCLNAPKGPTHAELEAQGQGRLL